MHTVWRLVGRDYCQSHVIIRTRIDVICYLVPVLLPGSETGQKLLSSQLSRSALVDLGTLNVFVKTRASHVIPDY